MSILMFIYELNRYAFSSKIDPAEGVRVCNEFSMRHLLGIHLSPKRPESLGRYPGSVPGGAKQTWEGAAMVGSKRFSGTG